MHYASGCGYGMFGPVAQSPTQLPLQCVVASPCPTKVGGSSSTGPLPIPSRASTASVAKPHAVAPMQPPVFPVVTPNPLKTVEGLDLTWSSDPFQTDTDKAVKLQEEYIKQFRKHPSLGYTGTPAKAKLPAAKVIVFALCLCHIVYLQLHLILSMGGRVVISHFKRGHTT